MQTETKFVPVIDYVPVYVALESSPDGGVYEVLAADRQERTGSESIVVSLADGPHRKSITFHGATLVSLGDRQLTLERERLQRLREAADQALEAVESHIQFRKGLRQ